MIMIPDRVWIDMVYRVKWGLNQETVEPTIHIPVLRPKGNYESGSVTHGFAPFVIKHTLCTHGHQLTSYTPTLFSNISNIAPRISKLSFLHMQLQKKTKENQNLVIYWY